MSRGCAGTNGSPPQVRGKPCHAGSVPAATRITPAGAGKTLTLGQPSIVARGSPPQVRGKPIAVMISGSAPRITPAGAGKTMPAPTPQGLRKDHPRRCGENKDLMVFKREVSGSPPQVRGKHVLRPPPDLWLGITPAGAGKTVPTVIKS